MATRVKIAVIVMHTPEVQKGIKQEEGEVTINNPYKT